MKIFLGGNLTINAMGAFPVASSGDIFNIYTITIYDGGSVFYRDGSFNDIMVCEKGKWVNDSYKTISFNWNNACSLDNGVYDALEAIADKQ